LLVGLFLLPRPASAQVVNSNLWGINYANVTAMARSGNTLYVGGAFSQVGPNTGSGIPLHYGRGAPAESYAKVNGEILAAVSDGSGGWFIGGDFTAVGGLPRLHLAHVLADGEVAEWSPDPDRQVRTLALSGGTLYVGGQFNTIATKVRNRIAALDAATGEAISWDPNATGTLYTVGAVTAIAVHGDTVCVGGNFTSIGGQARSCLAAVDARTGQAMAWNPSPNFEVNAIALNGNTAFVGGGFSQVGGHERYLVAAVDLTSGVVTDWDARIGNRLREYWEPAPEVNALMVRGSRVYIGGLLDSLGGRYRSALGAVDLETGQVSAWDPRVAGGFPYSYVRALAAHGDTIYVGGYFSTIGGVTRICLVGLDATTAAATEWDPRPNDEVNALSVEDDRIYGGGAFTCLGSWQVRNNLAAIDLTTGQPNDWNPDPNGLVVYELAVQGGTVYAGGDFTSVGGQSRSGIAALDAVSGAATGWNPAANGAVSAIVLRGDTVYAGGGFTRIGGQTRSHLAALNGLTGLATDWDARLAVRSSVYAMVMNHDTIYLGGDFVSIGDERRVGLAALDAATGAPRPWRADASGWVNALAMHEGRLYVAGVFDTLADEPRASLASVDATSGALTAWNPTPSGQVGEIPYYGPPKLYAIAALGHELYVGGNFSRIGGTLRLGFAAVDDSVGAATGWDPGANEIVWSLLSSGSTLFVGGKFRTIGGLPTARLAAVSFPPPDVPAAPTLALAQSAPNPARTTAVIHFVLPSPGPVTLEVFDVQGRRVATLLAREPYAAGGHDVLVRAEQWGSGAYFYRLEAAGQRTTRKMLVVK
jgi:hypothetical protein